MTRTVVAANDQFVFCSDGAVFVRTGYHPRWQETDPIPGTARDGEREGQTTEYSVLGPIPRMAS